MKLDTNLLRARLSYLLEAVPNHRGGTISSTARSQALASGSVEEAERLLRACRFAVAAA